MGSTRGLRACRLHSRSDNRHCETGEATRSPSVGARGANQCKVPFMEEVQYRDATIVVLGSNRRDDAQICAYQRLERPLISCTNGSGQLRLLFGCQAREFADVLQVSEILVLHSSTPDACVHLTPKFSCE